MSDEIQNDAQKKDDQEESVTLEDLQALRKALASERSLKKGLEKELKELQEETEKTTNANSEELDKLKDKIASLESEKKNMEVANLKTNKIIEHGLPLESMDFIGGTTEDEILKQIEKFKSLVSTKNADSKDDKKAPEPNRVFGDKTNTSPTTKSLLGNYIRESI